MKPTREQDIQRTILQYLHLRGILAWRNNSGAMRAITPTGKSRLVRFNTATGSSDIFAVLPGGRFLSIEVKRPGNKPTARQADWLATVTAHGGLAIVATCVEDVMRHIP